LVSDLLSDEKIINITSSRRYLFFTRAKFDANNGLFKENLVKYKGKRTSQDVMFIVFSSLRDEKIINITSSRRYLFFTRAKFDANNGLFKENLVKYKGKRTSQDVMFIVFSSLSDEKIINITSSRRYLFFTRAKFDANNGLFKENLVKYKGKRTSRECTFILFLIHSIATELFFVFFRRFC